MAPRSLLVSDQSAPWHLDAARGPSTPSFDHCISKREQFRGYFKIKHLCGLEIDDELNSGRLGDRQVSWFDASENFANVDTDLTIAIGQTGAIAYEASGLGIFAPWIDRRYFVVCGKRGNSLAIRGEEC